MAWVGNWEGGRIWRAKDGRTVYYIRRMVRGKPYNLSTHTTTLRSALKQLDRFEAEPDRYAARPPTALLITDVLIDQFVEAGRQAGNSEGRVWKRRHYMGWWRDHLRHDLRTLNSQDVYKVIDGVKNAEVRKSILKTFLGWLSAQGKVDRVPDITVVPSQPAQFTRPKLISFERHQEMLANIGEKWRDILIVLAGTGWHISDLERFAVEGRIEYPEDPADAENLRYVLVTPRHKSGDIHKTQVSEKVEEAAVRVLEREKFHRNHLGRAMRDAARKGKFPAYPASWYRHSVATWAIERGADPGAVSTFLGHRHPATVKRFYATHAVVPKVPTME